MSVTFTSPIRVYKRNNPTNDGTIAPDNTGAAIMSQQAKIADITATRSAGALPTYPIGSTTATAFTLPAGSIVHSISMYETTAPSALTGGVITVAIAGVNVGTLTPTTAGGKIDISLTASAAVAAVLANVGTTDATVTFTATAITGTFTGTLSATFNVEYTARNVDGSIINTGSGYTNA
jgi:hypothetical protein